MIKKLLPFNILFLMLILLSCNNSKIDKTYFGGQIINPKTNYVVLLKQETPLDTFYLSENNRFIGELKNNNEGLYYFKHGNEFQYIYLEPKDSLLFRLNTLNFDESLVFSGNGAERNNFLIDCFIDSEKDNKIFYDYYKLKPDEFTEVVNSLENTKLDKFNNFISRNSNESEKCLDFLKIAITYPLYSKIENYPLNHARMLKKNSFVKMSDSFYKHRANLNLNEESLIYYGVYSNFLTNYLYNKTYASGFKPYIKDYSPEFTKKLLEITDENIDIESTKNILLKQEIKYHFFRNSENKINQNVFDTYFSLNTNKEHETQIKNLITDTQSLENDEKIINFKVYDYNNSSKNINQIIDNKNTLIYFWNPQYISDEFISSRIKYLSTKNKNVQFIGVKIDGNNKNHIKDLDIKNQYYINASNDANLFLSSKMPRVVLVNKDGIIINSYASISSKKIFRQVKNLNKTN